MQHGLICEHCGSVFFSAKKIRKYCSRKCANQQNAVDRIKKLKERPPTTVWSCGGGVESTIIAVLIANGTLPKPDYAIMVDCGWEKESTWEYVNNVIKPRLEEVGVFLRILNTNDYSSNSIFDSHGTLLIPAFESKNGTVSKYRTHCNNGWKGTVVRRWMREEGLSYVESWIGVADNERQRRRNAPKAWNPYRYPLVELGITREEGVWLIGRNGWPMPRRTSCYICPMQHDRDWAKMKKKGKLDFERAVEVEQYIQKIKPNVYLHRSCVPLDEVSFERG